MVIISISLIHSLYLVQNSDKRRVCKKEAHIYNYTDTLTINSTTENYTTNITPQRDCTNLTKSLFEAILAIYGTETCSYAIVYHSVLYPRCRHRLVGKSQIFYTESIFVSI